MKALDALPLRSSPLRSGKPRPTRKSLVCLVLLALLVLVCVLLYYRSLGLSRTIPGLVVGEQQLPSLSDAELQQLVADEWRRLASAPLTLKVATQQLIVTRKELGAQLDHVQAFERAMAAGKSGSFFQDVAARVRARRGKLQIPLVARLEQESALRYFVNLKDRVDQLPIEPRLDLERGEVIPGRDGQLLSVYDCLAAAELALNRQQSIIELPVTVTQPKGGQRLHGLDIRQLLGEFSTVYSLADKDADRGHNLKVGASKLDGAILQPGATLSFNEMVGQRTEEQGYRTAPVIFEGELVDGMAGGACQLSSTLFAAAFFAGLELKSSRPHTRPSSYIKMGLDAAVAYPSTDMVIANPYPFPVAIHFTVSQGKVNVRILGKQRPWRRVVFEREIKETIAFATETRKDETIPRGKQVVSQRGVPGFRLERRRLFYAAGKEPAQREQRLIHYPPTTEIILEGSGPADPSWQPPKEPSPFGEAPPEFSMEQ